MSTPATSIPAALARRRDYVGPVLFSYGFRPFFLAGAAWAALAIVLWLPQFAGEITLPIAWGPLDWHIHEMIYGYVTAAIAGFLLTAIPNWTGRLPVCGPPLALLVALWLAGRIAMLTSAAIGGEIAAVIDLSFLVTFAALALREILAGKSRRNLSVLMVLFVLIAGNIVFHIEVLRSGVAVYGPRIGVAAVILLITLIGGRIIPSFTHNWIVRNNPGRLPSSFSRFDAACLAAGVIALASWTVMPVEPVSGILMMAAGALHLVRLVRWAGDRAIAERLVAILHLAYLFVPTGFLMIGASVLWPQWVPLSAGLHAWTTGAIALMTLAVMTRATLGHTGQPLTASPATQAIYLCAMAAAILRIAAAFTGGMLLLHIAAIAWVAAFGGFVALYGPLLAGRPPAWIKRR